MSAWVAWTLGSAVFLSLYDLAKKASVRNNAVIPVLLCSTLAGCAAYLVGLGLSGRFGAALLALDARVWSLGLAKAVIVASSWIFTFCALRTLPITIATPIRSSSPALVFVLAFFIYGEIPTIVQALGMVLVFAGYLTFSWAGKHEGIDFLKSRAVWCALMGAVLAAVSSLWDKYVFQVCASPIEPTQVVYQLGLVAVYALCLLAQLTSRPSPVSSASPASHTSHTSRPSHTSHTSHTSQTFQWRWTIPLVGILLAVSDYLIFHAIAEEGTAISLMSLMRRFSVALTFVFGALFFRETNLRRKGVALFLVLSGIALLIAR